MRIGLDQADQVASVVGALAGVLGLFLTIRYARGHRSAPPDRRPGRPRADSAEVAGGIVGMILSVAMLALCVWGGVWAVRAAWPDGDEPAGGQAGPGKPTASTAAEAEEPPPVPVLWSGEILLDDTPREFDTEPPARGNYSTDMRSDAYLNGDSYTKFWGGPLVLWPGKADPARDACATRLQTHGREAVSVARGSRVCLRTNGGRIVFLKLLKRDGNGYIATVKVWGPPDG